MQIFIAFAVLACASASPLYLTQEVSYPKSTLTSASHSISHGSTHLLHTIPVVHASPVVHSVQAVHLTPVVHAAPEYKVATSSQNFKLDSYNDVKSYHAVPSYTQVHEVHALPVVHSSPVYYKSAGRSGDSAVSQQSSTVHKTEHLVHSVPLYTLHH